MRSVMVFALCISAGCSGLEPSGAGASADMRAGDGNGGNGGSGGSGGTGGSGGPTDMATGPDLWQPETLVPTRAYLESVSDDETELAYLGSDHQLTNGVETGSLQVTALPPGAPPLTLAMSGASDARFYGAAHLLLFNTDTHGLALWKPGMTAPFALTSYASAFAGAPDGSFVIFDDTATAPGRWNLVRTSSCAGASCTITAIADGSGAGTHVVVSSDGKYAAYEVLDNAGDGTAYLVDVGAAKAQQLLVSTAFTTAPSVIGFSSDGTLLATRGNDNKQPTIYSTATGATVSWASVGPSIDDELTEVVFAGSTDVFVLKQKGGLWRTTAAAAKFIGSGSFDWFTVAPPYRYLFAHTPANGATPESLQMFDLSATPPTATTLDSIATAPQVSPDGAYLAFLRKSAAGDPTGQLRTMPLPSGTATVGVNVIAAPPTFTGKHSLLYLDADYSPTPLFQWNDGNEVMILSDVTSYAIRGATLYYSTQGYHRPIGILRQPL